MKKIIALLLAAVMLTLTISLVSCSGNDNPGTSTDGTTTDGTTPAGTTTEGTTTTEKPDEPIAPTFASALELYNKIWSTYTDEEKFPSAGGDQDHSSENPGVVDIEKYKDTIMFWTHITEDLLGTVTNDSANLMHMMNINTFSSAIFHLKDASTAEKFAEDYKTAVQATRWMCGFPDKVIVVSVGEYVIVAFGHTEIIDTFKTKCLAVDTSAKLLVEASAMPE